MNKIDDLEESNPKMFWKLLNSLKPEMKNFKIPSIPHDLPFLRFVHALHYLPLTYNFI
jgi:hypothetical protein